VLGVECVAVSVENSETVTALKQMGMPWLQGFFIGKPEPWA
jgi:EAL domain-containing protein (putative c-di-GMP-specific phosphodiesterase class I)